MSELAPIMADLILPEGGRIELENYLKTLTTRLANECPPQLRHFLRPSSSVGKKADVIVPRLDRFLAKTVSGVFNSLKTVVSGFEIEQEEETIPLPTLMPLADIPWRFVEDIKSVIKLHTHYIFYGLYTKSSNKIHFIVIEKHDN